MPRVPRRRRIRPTGLGLLLAPVGVLVTAGGCRSHGRVRVVSPVEPAAGRSPLCPDHPVGEAGSPDLRRCSFEDAAGPGPTRVSGRVVIASGPDDLLGRGLAGAIVTIHRVDDDARAPGHGPRVGRAATDTQGRFSLSIVLPPGRYDVAARLAPEGPVLAALRIDLSGRRSRRLDDLRLVVRTDAVGPGP